MIYQENSQSDSNRKKVSSNVQVKIEFKMEEQSIFESDDQMPCKIEQETPVKTIKLEFNSNKPKQKLKQTKKLNLQKKAEGQKISNKSQSKMEQYQYNIYPQIKNNKKVSQVELRARKILQNHPQQLGKQTLTYYKKITYRGISLTQIVRPNKQSTFLSRKTFPVVLGSFNSFYEITQGKIVNVLDPTYTQSTWKILNRQRYTCNCTKSHCKKSYCQCFLNKRVCGQGCGCLDCQNTQPHQKLKQEIFSIGCQCNKSQCLTSYCRCKKLEINCGEYCKCCEDCKN